MGPITNEGSTVTSSQLHTRGVRCEGQGIESVEVRGLTGGMNRWSRGEGRGGAPDCGCPAGFLTAYLRGVALVGEG